MTIMIRNGYARRLQAQVEQSRVTSQWQGYPQSVQRSLQLLLQEHGLVAAQRATEVLVAYAASSEAVEEAQDSGLPLEGERTIRKRGDLKGTYQYFPLQSLLPPEHYLLVDVDYEMVHLMRQSYPPFVMSQRWRDVELAILLPLLRAWPAPASYETFYEALCLASWEGTFREFRRSLPVLWNACSQKLRCYGMEIVVNASSVQLVSCP